MEMEGLHQVHTWATTILTQHYPSLIHLLARVIPKPAIPTRLQAPLCLIQLSNSFLEVFRLLSMCVVGAFPWPPLRTVGGLSFTSSFARSPSHSHSDSFSCFGVRSPCYGLSVWLWTRSVSLLWNRALKALLLLLHISCISNSRAGGSML